MENFAGLGGRMPRGAPRLRTPDGKMNGVGERVREVRERMKLTQDALCGRISAGTDGKWIPDRRDIFRIEDGRRSVHDTEVVALSAALETDVCWLLLGKRSV
jgi:hypothetical protein